MGTYFSSYLKWLLSSGILIILISCSSSKYSETDITYLNENYFVSDSVSNTPVKIELRWHPNVKDRVKIKVTGNICSSINLLTDWISDSLISIDVDAGKEYLISVESIFELSSFSAYNFNLVISIDNKELFNEAIEFYKTPGSLFTTERFHIYLPLFRSSGIIRYGSVPNICTEHPLGFILFRPDCFDSLNFDSSFDIRDNFSVLINSDKNKVVFYDKFKRQSAGNKIDARLNELQKYGVLLLNSANSIMDDTISIEYKCSKFTTNFYLIVQKQCPEIIEISNIKVKFNGNMYPGDTLIVVPSLINDNGEEEYFSEDTEFDVFIRDDCEFADIIGPGGETGDFFGEMKQPIKIIILGTPDDGTFGIGVALVPSKKYGSYPKY